MNRVPGHWVMPSGEIIRKIDAVILAGDLFDRARPEIIDLYCQRYECGKGEKRIHFPVYPVLEIMTWIRLQKARPRITRYTCS